MDKMNAELEMVLKLNKLKVERGSRYSMPKQDDTEMMEQFDQQSKEFETIVSEANKEKQKIRQEIAELEADIREKRDQVANMQVKNKNQQYLNERESEIREHRAELEKRALTVLSEDL